MPSSRPFAVLFPGILLVALSVQAQTAPQLARDYVRGPGGRVAVTIEPDNYPPEQVLNVSAVMAGQCSDDGVDVSWDATVDVGSGVSHYAVSSSGGGGGNFTTLSFRDFQVYGGTTVTYWVSGVDNVGHTGPSGSNSIYIPLCFGSLFFPSFDRQREDRRFAHVSLLRAPPPDIDFRVRALLRIRLNLIRTTRYELPLVIGGGL